MLETYSQTASLFIKLRQYLGLTREQVAARLRTEPAVVAALETGAFTDLPPWPHTRRIVCDYAALAGIDPTPALSCIEYCLEAGPTHPHHVRYAQPQPAAPPIEFTQHAQLPEAIPIDDEAETDVAAAPSRMQRLSALVPRNWPLIRIAAVMVVISVAGFFSQSATLQAAMTKLPSPVGSLFRDAREAILLRTSAKFEGMPWIDVADPRTRREDKLPIKSARRAVKN